jgi:hypothetical protein
MRTGGFISGRRRGTGDVEALSSMAEFAVAAARSSGGGGSRAGRGRLPNRRIFSMNVRPGDVEATIRRRCAWRR